jgi:hypothetical protein
LNDLAFHFDPLPSRETRCARMIVAIPAMNEADRIHACLAALATQRDRYGSPLAPGSFEIVVLANNCSDDTADIAAAMSRVCPHPILVVSENLHGEQANAGWARKRAMDIAADRLVRGDRSDGLILTTDADSLVSPTWIDATRRAIDAGADGVAGYIDAQPDELMGLGRRFLERGRLEDRYLSAVAEIYALCDPRAHDPWPNHRVSSGASLAVTLDAYLSIGGLPAKPVGEDAALTAALDKAGFRIRHSLEVCVSTSCRFDGRARGGAADTMQMRHEVLDAPCDDDLEPALAIVRRALLKGWLRRFYEDGRLGSLGWEQRAGVDTAEAKRIWERCRDGGFEDFWAQIAEASAKLRAHQTLRPSNLPRQIERAKLCLRALRKPLTTNARTDGPAGIAGHATRAAPAVA